VLVSGLTGHQSVENMPLRAEQRSITDSSYVSPSTSDSINSVRPDRRTEPQNRANVTRLNSVVWRYKLAASSIIIVYYAIRQPHNKHTMLCTVQNIKAHIKSTQ